MDICNRRRWDECLYLLDCSFGFRLRACGEVDALGVVLGELEDGLLA